MKKKKKQKKKSYTWVIVLSAIIFIFILFIMILAVNAKKQNPTRLIKKVSADYVTLQEALNSAININRGANPMDWVRVRTFGNKSEAIIKELSNFLPIENFCTNTKKNCLNSKIKYQTLNGKPTTILTDPMEPPERYILDDEYVVTSKEQDIKNQPIRRAARPKYSTSYALLKDGSTVIVKTYSDRCQGLLSVTDNIDRKLCGTVYLDINGAKAPNMLGVDVFGFWLTETGLLPMGFYGDGMTFSGYCLRETPYYDKSNGLGCSAWVLKQKNMDYRKCQAGPRIDWVSKTTCEQSAK